MKFLMTLLMMTAMVSCQKQNEDWGPDIEHYSDMIGHKIICKHQNGEAHVFFYSPHIIGIWSTDPKYMTEYFRTVNLDKQDYKIYYESIMTGTWDLISSMKKPDDPANRRIMLEIKDKRAFLTVVHGIDNETRAPADPQLYPCIRGPKIEDYWAGEALEKASDKELKPEARNKPAP